MRKITTTILTVALAVTLATTPVSAANKLTVNTKKVTTKTTRLSLSMTTKKKYKITIKYKKSGKKKKQTLVIQYTGKKKSHKVYIPKLKKGKLYISVAWQNSKGKYKETNSNCAKTVKVEKETTTKAPETTKTPEPETKASETTTTTTTIPDGKVYTAEELLAAALADLKAGKDHYGATIEVKSYKDYVYNSDGGAITVGDYEKYIENDEPALDKYGLRKYAGIKAINGATLYVNVFWGGRINRSYEKQKNWLAEGVSIGWTAEQLEEWYAKFKDYNFDNYSQIADPTLTQYDYKINPGEEVVFYAKDYPDTNELGCVCYKIYAYVNGKLMAVRYDGLSLTGVKGSNYEPIYQ